ncbi:ROK family transcriptional regulator [Sinobaca sp. H24]|uniref:ROK family transcriptional regulator n=1 Tax=Sinobaca sp. H24 TaxID=2923376 RepID=UPI0020794AE0|nr:ROK family transcriptional regulator [Sinobaca sp. H24]
MNTGDTHYIKRMNRRIIIENVIKHVSLSRSELSRITGLNKATISSQVGELMEEGHIVERETGASVTRGRKPIMIEINERAGFTIGIDIDEQVTNILCCDLKGQLIHRQSVALDTHYFDEMTESLLHILKEDILPAGSLLQEIPLVGIGVGIHGIVNNDHQIVFTPKQEWIDEDIKSRLEQEMNVPVFIDNSANLSVFAEQVYYEQVSDLFCLTLHSGIGLGIIKDFNIYRGFQGFAGEIGHMIVEPNGLPCPCGNHGCWEMYASNKALLKNLHQDAAQLSTESMAALFHKEVQGSVLDDYLDYLALGLNNVINIFNPERIVINSALFSARPELLADLISRFHSKFNNYDELKISRLNEDACAYGAAALAFKGFFDITIVDHSKRHSEQMNVDLV